MVRVATFSQVANVTILRRAHAGLIRTRADLVLVGDRSDRDIEIPSKFWWAEGHQAIEQNWEVGDFSTYVDKQYLVRAFGVQFDRAGLNELLPGAFDSVPKALAQPDIKEAGGRPMSPLWAAWVAELVAEIHRDGFPAGAGTKGASELIKRVADSLAERGLEGPSRTTVQETVNAVLRRHRSAGNTD